MSVYPRVLVTGIFYRGKDARVLADSLQNDTVLRLEREPTNDYDPNAIKVFFEDTFIGYIERGQAAWISPELDEGKSAKAEVIDKEPYGKAGIHTAPLLRIEVSESNAEPEAT